MSGSEFATTGSITASKAWVSGRLQAARIEIANGVIASVITGEAALQAPSSADPRTVVRVPEGTVLLPGLVDSHVHINEPGRTEWEGFESATLAAAAGGVTTLVDMPLNSIPPTTTAEALRLKRAAAAGAAFVDVGFWGGVIPENLGALAPLHEAGVFGFKCFLSPSGVDEFPHLDRAQLLEAMHEIAALDSRIIVHAEDPALLGTEAALGSGYQRFLDSRPPASEQSAIEAVIDGVRRTGCRAHILHLSDASSLPAIRAAKAEGLPLTVETCPHYLTITAEQIPDGAVEFKCCPPIREASNRDRLWAGIKDGTIDAIVSDHSPSTIELKRVGGGDFGLGWGGISGLQLGFSAVWSEARTRGVTLDTLLPLFTSGPVEVAGLGETAPGIGTIAVGAPAHLTVFDPHEPVTIEANTLLHRNPITAYDGRTITGRIRQTWLAGRSVFDAAAGGAGEAPQLRRDPAGRLLNRHLTAPISTREEATA